MLFEVGQLQALDLGLGGCQVRIRASSPVPTPARGKANSPRSMLPGLALPNCLGEGQGQLSLLQEAAKEKPSQLSSAQVSSPLGYVHGPRCQPRLPMSKWPLLVTGHRPRHVPQRQHRYRYQHGLRWQPRPLMLGCVPQHLESPFCLSS